MNWSSVLLPNKISEDCSLDNQPSNLIEGKEMVSISSEILKEVTRDCEKLVVGYFIGKRRSFSEVQFAIANTSKMEAEFIGVMEIKLIDERHYSRKKCASGPKERLKQLYMLPKVLLRHRVHLVRMGDIGDHPYPDFEMTTLKLQHQSIFNPSRLLL
ncbi:uncharacterized protein LOC113324731 [Papaver somniferum]|uniref:uncharacterized protein LOC113324731 n=1 Tax=Papaver somniferum TaxID=3469 RepID=UPI000E6FFE09|nr:uncharacterized protein LOC113324731 [Papaver somniferum]